jgi:hypothetical protein
MDAIITARRAVAEAEENLAAARAALKEAEGRVDPIDLLIDGNRVSDARRETLERAIALGATQKSLESLRDAVRVCRRDTIGLPQGRYASCSRGKSWCRKGRGDSAMFVYLEANGEYRVGPGRWTVGSNDGFNRKEQTPWHVKHVKVGTETWTIAS